MAAPLPPQPPQQKSNTVVWVVVGCAGLLVLGLCVAGGVAYWWFTRETLLGPDDIPVTFPQGPPPAVPDGSGSGAGSGPMLPPPPAMQPDVRTVSATVTATTGAAPVAVGTTCQFVVERHPRPDPPGFWCRAQISCGGVLLYGGPSAGFFPCELYEQPRRDVVGRDDDTTAADTDAAMSLDTRQGTLSIRDDTSGPHGVYSLEARVTEVR